MHIWRLFFKKLTIQNPVEKFGRGLYPKVNTRRHISRLTTSSITATYLILRRFLTISIIQVFRTLEIRHQQAFILMLETNLVPNSIVKFIRIMEVGIKKFPSKIFRYVLKPMEARCTNTAQANEGCDYKRSKFIYAKFTKNQILPEVQRLVNKNKYDLRILL